MLVEDVIFDSGEIMGFIDKDGETVIVGKNNYEIVSFGETENHKHLIVLDKNDLNATRHSFYFSELPNADELYKKCLTGLGVTVAS